MIYNILKLDLNNGEVISVVGGGGKTTTIFQLAKELKSLNKKVLITTTTAIYNPDEKEYDCFFLEDIKDFQPTDGTITIFGQKIVGEKLIGVSLEKLDEIIEKRVFDFILIEADGAKKKPIKAPETYEPVITKNTTKTIGVIGLDSLGRAINEENVHRPEIFTKITNTKLSDIIKADIIIRLVLEKEGIFKSAKGEKILLLNKANKENLIKEAIEIRANLLNRGIENIVISNIKSKMFY
ncbi:putative selenium-dependent hydroxylase accessory protein YqeC [Tissierella pigra]|uniref:selenium cofactor biosynthesis protein YqeC n=1 Tax=Tissierella pigra TaxID=2607614 RepID=UPI001C105361|nr:selenium cofactor biosynthesis protein YqeC [Tissierella pigra]MBU5425188.1 putative selenium-dependent hydroxylase accessory protein YqeC [Tissierella pigra]